jgi:hypothetical protein
MMPKFIYAHEQPVITDIFNRWVFLAGPSPRDDSDLNWRLRAIEIAEEYDGFENVVFFIPLPRDGDWNQETYDAQINWELKYLTLCDWVAFWIPRSKTLPGFTTNVEFGMFIKKAILGYPFDADKVRYLESLYSKYTSRFSHNSLMHVMIECIESRRNHLRFFKKFISLQ